jgi:hypothetical protein
MAWSSVFLTQVSFYAEKMVQGHYVTRPNANRPNVNWRNVTFAISNPMSPGQMSPTPNVA